MKPTAYAYFDKIKKKWLARASMYETAEAKQFKKDMVKLIKSEIKKQDFKFDTKPYFVITDWTLFFPKTNMDSNNYYKTFLDACTELNGLIWEDDNISMVRDSNIYYDSNNPRIELKIYASDRVGIFNNQEEYNQFVATYCRKCKSGKKIGEKGGCSVYKKLMESRIIDEVPMDTEGDRNNKKCLKFKER